MSDKTDISREQVADLILKSPEGNDMVVCSDLGYDAGNAVFEVADLDTGQRFTITVRSEEV